MIESTQSLLEHLFRQQAGRITARLTRLLGPAHLDLAEESVQEAMLRALQTWPYHGNPENPQAWLFQTAHNAAMDAVRKRKLVRDKEDAVLAALTQSSQKPVFEEQIRDDELRMIFMCCHPEIPENGRVALSLKTVGGFSVGEIAAGLLMEEAAVAQHIVRAKRRIREQALTLDLPAESELAARLESALQTIYLMFNEGYAAHDGDALVREDLVREAFRLGRLIAASSLVRPNVHALVALMALQSARMTARTDAAGDLILLEHQDRSRWDQKLIAMGFAHFDRSMEGDEVTSFHVQAAIAATHARAVVPEAMPWEVLLPLYDQLLAMNPSPIVALNRAVVVAKLLGAAEGLALIESLQSESLLLDYYLLPAVHGHLLLELGRRQDAAACFRRALAGRCSAPERRFLHKKLAECEAL